ncbi:hypothetical protein K466DRAFT_659886 [Polyporus arcularius HHB13444]|uniref:RlpA-like protein double-psi beta-barrel domain-containing protein n=1 Tax=Polyporus arcularius HHB13444 TaxID=1314778 RepID=A0A5C3PRA0_9APHY|nr:hypothetical protein K466DRAFT_659886 [Polyporus arcularius HHB13444]
MMFPKAFVVASLALSVLATPHMARHVDHRAVAHRAAMPDAAPEPVVVPAKKKRADSRCKVRSSSSAPAATSSSIVPVKNVQSAAPTSSEAPPTTKAAEPTTKAAEPTTTPSSTKEKPTSTKEPATTEKPTTSSKAAEPTSSPSSGSANDPLGILTGKHVGQGTFYATGLGSCGITNSDSDFIAAVSHQLYDNYPGYNGANPNNNDLCNRKINATYKGKTITVRAVDRCTGCAIWDLDFSPSAFLALSPFEVGRIDGLTWEWAS